MLDANVKLQARTNLNTVPGREQSTTALLYSDWLIAYFYSLSYGCAQYSNSIRGQNRKR